MIRTLKTKQFKITALVLAVVLTLSCVFWNSTKVHAQELEIKNTSIQTFAGGGAVDNGKLVGVFVTGGSANKYIATNTEWTHDGTGWASTSTVLYEGANSQQKISAYYPYVENCAGTITVNAADQIDYLVATSTALTSATTSLTMTHAMTKLVVNISSFGTEVSGDDTIAKIEVTDMYASGTWTIADNAWSDLSEADATLEMTNNEVLVIPMEDYTFFSVVITMSSGKVFRTGIALENGLLPGTQYNINLQVGQDIVVLKGITAAPWGKPVPGGQLETE